MRLILFCVLLSISSIAFGDTTIHTLPGEQRCCTGSSDEEVVYTTFVSRPNVDAVVWNVSLAGSFQSSESNTIYFTFKVGDERVFNFVTSWRETATPWTLTASVRSERGENRRVLMVNGQFAMGDGTFPVTHVAIDTTNSDDIPFSVLGTILNGTPKTENDKVLLTQFDIVQQ